MRKINQVITTLYKILYKKEDNKTVKSISKSYKK